MQAHQRSKRVTNQTSKAMTGEVIPQSQHKNLATTLVIRPVVFPRAVPRRLLDPAQRNLLQSQTATALVSTSDSDVVSTTICDTTKCQSTVGCSMEPTTTSSISTTTAEACEMPTNALEDDDNSTFLSNQYDLLATMSMAGMQTYAWMNVLPIDSIIAELWPEISKENLGLDDGDDSTSTSSSPETDTTSSPSTSFSQFSNPSMTTKSSSNETTSNTKSEITMSSSTKSTSSTKSKTLRTTITTIVVTKSHRSKRQAVLSQRLRQAHQRSRQAAPSHRSQMVPPSTPPHQLSSPLSSQHKSLLIGLQWLLTWIPSQLLHLQGSTVLQLPILMTDVLHTCSGLYRHLQ